MKQHIAGNSPIWLIFMALAGAGCVFMGSYAPAISATWKMHDGQVGTLLSSLFIGSFTGTMLLSRDLRRTLRMGGFCASAGLILFAWQTERPSGFAPGAAAAMLFGFGLGQIMSSINLLVGSGPVEIRSRSLAHLGSAWCCGAMISPALTSVAIAGISPAHRLFCLAPIYLVLAGSCEFRELPSREASPASVMTALGLPRAAVFWGILLLVYGGVEASVSGWVPTFALRYHMGSEVLAQWSLSIFWCGLIVGRTLTAVLVTPARETATIRTAAAGTVCCLLWMIAAPSPVALLFGIPIAGICLGPLFPLLLASSMECKLSTRVMGLLLGMCGMGNAIFPALLGLLSNAVDLRLAMLLPAVMLVVLLRLYAGRPMIPVNF